MDAHIDIRHGSNIALDQLIALYNAVGWLAYTRDERSAQLPTAIRNSTYVVTAWHADRLVGLARGLSDDVSIFYLQDILVHPDYQRQGIGRKLLQNCLDRYHHVRTKLLLTDDEEKQKTFYRSLGFTNTNSLRNVRLNTYVQIDNITLE